MKFRRCCPSLDLPATPRKRRGAHPAFTLVELLVVIGIIALLISILLPALSSARKQAQKIKCAASLHDINNAVVMYVQDNNGWAPPAKLLGGSYNLYNGSFTATNACYWFNFLSKYETKTNVGFSATNSSQVTISQQSIFYSGCPAWQQYLYNGPASSNPLNVSTQPGYGMNAFPEFTPSYPPRGATLGEVSGAQAPSVSPNPPYCNDTSVVDYSTTYHWTPPESGMEGPNGATPYGKWYKFSQFTHPSDRALLGDCLFWLMEALPPLPPPNFAGQYYLGNQGTWASELDGGYETTFDFYRHGTYPKLIASDLFDRKGGKVGFNVLFCDGHVATMIDRQSAYQVVRMRYPF